MFMAGMKFGTTGQEALTWAINSFLPGVIAELLQAQQHRCFFYGECIWTFARFQRWFSREGDALNPSGEYAMSCLGRERDIRAFQPSTSARR